MFCTVSLFVWVMDVLLTSLIVEHRLCFCQRFFYFSIGMVKELAHPLHMCPHHTAATCRLVYKTHCTHTHTGPHINIFAKKNIWILWIDKRDRRLLKNLLQSSGPLEGPPQLNVTAGWPKAAGSRHNKMITGGKRAKTYTTKYHQSFE